MSQIIQELEKAYDLLNEELFKNNLPKSVINIRYNEKAAKDSEYITLGVFYPFVSWQINNKNLMAISITTDALNKGKIQVLSTLVHEMVHAYCKICEIEDITKRKHNEEFKKYAEMAKLEVKKDKKVGFGMTFPTAELLDIFSRLQIDDEAFNMKCSIEYKEKTKNIKPKKIKIKHICPQCNRKAESREDTPLICGVCNMLMLQSKNEDK